MARIIALSLAGDTTPGRGDHRVDPAPSGGVDHERLLRAVMDHAQTGLLTLALGVTGPRVASANRYAVAMLALDLDEGDPEGRAWADVLHPEDRLRVGRGVGQVLAGALPTWQGEVRLLGPDRRVISVVLSPVPRVDGHEDVVLAQLTDRTSEYTAAERVAGAQAVLTELANAGGALTLVVDDKGVVLRFSDAAERVSGFAAEEVVGRPFWLSLVEPEGHAEAARAFSELDGQGRLAVPPVGVGSWRTRDGESRQVLWVRTPMAWGPRRAHLFTAIDLTEQRLASGVLEAMARPSSRTAVVGADADGVITYVNTAAERTTGRTAAELRGLTLAALVDPAELEQRAAVVGTVADVEALVAPLRGGAQVDRQDWHLTRPGQPSSPVSVTLAASRDADGSVSGYVAVIVDVTEFRLAEERLNDALTRELRVVEELRRLDEQRTDFAVTVSHELRTPVASVLGFTELLLDDGAGELTATQRSMLERVERNGLRLKTLVEDLLDLTTPCRAPEGSRRPRLPVEDLVRQAVATQQPLIDSRDIEVDLVGPPTPTEVEGDPAQLVRAVAHVLSNAVKFSPDFATVRVVTRVDDDGVTVTVRDHGYGIPAHEIESVFDRFFRGSVSHLRATQGAGLGLTLARAVAEAHGGCIDVRSVEGDGTEVALRFPVAG